MKKRSDRPSAAFVKDKLLKEGPLGIVALAVKKHLAASPESSVLIFDDETGNAIDLDLRGSDEDVIDRLDHAAQPEPVAKAPAGRGRPSLGVIAREVTLLPRQWDWLAKQRGGASATLRRLVDEARKQDGHSADQSASKETVYRAMRVLAGNREGFEEATRALFAGKGEAFNARMQKWPADVRRYLQKLAQHAFDSADQ